MRRRDFLILGGGTIGGIFVPGCVRAARERKLGRSIRADVVIAGAGLGGCAAALAALRNGLQVVLTEETDWIGGQLTSQAVPPDEHQWIETHGCTRSYRELRNRIRNYYRNYYPLNEAARLKQYLNPGDAHVSRVSHEPRVALAVLESMFDPYLSNGQLSLLLEHKVTRADIANDKVQVVQVVNVQSRREINLEATYFVDATELGDLLPLTGTEFVIGAESRKETGELHAAETADTANQQAFTVCLAADYVAGEEHVIEKPREFEFWKNYVPKLSPAWPGKLLDLTYTHPPTLKPRELGFNPEGDTPGLFNLWRYRRLINKDNFEPGTYKGDISLFNYPQNDYLPGNLVGVGDMERQRHIDRAAQLSLSLLYWLQTEAPRQDGGQGWPGLRLRSDLLGTDGVAKYPYVREARRIKSVFTILEQHVGIQARAILTGKPPAEVPAENFPDSVGVGSYPIDLHPTTAGDNYIDFQTRPFQIPLGALLPVRMDNLLPACKNIGTTHVTNGCYRLHPVEWNIGEATGCLVAFAVKRKTVPRQVREKPELLTEFQDWIRVQGIETHWHT